MRKRQCQRYTKRLEVTFASEGSKYTAISSDLSAAGLFIRTQHGLTPGSFVNIEVYLPDHTVGHLKGVVRRTVKTALSVIKNGMGVEIIERDQNYLEFLKKFNMLDCSGTEEATSSTDAGPAKSVQMTDTPPESVIIACSSCSTKNRVPTQRLSLGAKCGKCGAVLDMRDIT